MDSSAETRLNWTKPAGIGAITKIYAWIVVHTNRFECTTGHGSACNHELTKTLKQRHFNCPRSRLSFDCAAFGDVPFKMLPSTFVVQGPLHDGRGTSVSTTRAISYEAINLRLSAGGVANYAGDFFESHRSSRLLS